MENKFKVGDRVECIKRILWAPKGTKGTIKGIDVYTAFVQWDNNVGGFMGSRFEVPIGYGEWVLYEQIKKIEPAQQVIVNGTATILKKDGKTYKSICKPDDDFDAEKGVMLALLQSYGVSYKEIEELVKNAKIIKPKSDYKITLSQFIDLGKHNISAYIRCNTLQETILVVNKLNVSSYIINDLNTNLKNCNSINVWISNKGNIHVTDCEVYAPFYEFYEVDLDK